MKKSNAAADELKRDLTKIGDNSLMFALNFSILTSFLRDIVIWGLSVLAHLLLQMEMGIFHLLSQPALSS